MTGCAERLENGVDGQAVKKKKEKEPGSLSLFRHH